MSNSGLDALGVELVIPNGATFTVEGTLRGIAGEYPEDSFHPSSIVVSGTFNSSDGQFSPGFRPTISVGKIGKMTVGDVFWDSNCTDPYHEGNEKFDLAPGGTFTVLSNSNIAEYAESILVVEEGETVVAVTTDTGTVYSVTTETSGGDEGEEPTEPTPTPKPEPQPTPDGIVVTGADGTEMEGTFDTVDAALKADGAVTVTLNPTSTVHENSNGTTYHYGMSSGSQIGTGQTVLVKPGVTFQITYDAGTDAFGSAGKIVVEAGGRLRAARQVRRLDWHRNRQTKFNFWYCHLPV